jgi:hypothetical protein
MHSKIITESQLRKIIRETLEEILGEDININPLADGKFWFRRTNIWKEASNEIKQNGYTIINVPISKGNIISAKLYVSSRNGIVLDVGDTKREFGSIGDAFSILQQYVNNKRVQMT